MKSYLRRVVPFLILCLGLAGALEAQLSPISITSGTPPNAAVGTGYPLFVLNASDEGCETSTFTYTATNLPSWLSINVNGATAALYAPGTGATTTGPVTFTITANDSCSLAVPATSLAASATYTIQVSSRPESYFGVPTANPPSLGNPTQPFVINSVIPVFAGTNTAYVTCNDTATTDPCYIEDRVSDLTQDNSGNFVVAAYTNNPYGPTTEYGAYVTTFPAAGGTISTAPLFTVPASRVPASLQNDPDIPNLASITAAFSSAFVDSAGN